VNPTPITHRINETALALLDQHPDGLRWADLNRMIEAADAGFHPKTVNGCVWKLCERFPDEVYKPEKGVFRLVKYRE
jgi:hypothetical protein